MRSITSGIIVGIVFGLALTFIILILAGALPI